MARNRVGLDFPVIAGEHVWWQESRPAEDGRVAIRHVRRDALDLLKKLEKDGKVSEDDHERMSGEVQKATDQIIGEVDQTLAAKEKEIMTV